MRSSLLVRLALILTMAAVVGLPGIQAVASSAAETAPTVLAVAPRPAWTGLLAAPGDEESVVAGEREPTTPLVVKFRAQAQSAGQVDAHREAGARRADPVALDSTVRVEVPSRKLDQAMAAYAGRADVEYVEPEYTVFALYTPNDPQYPSQWALPKVSAESAWNTTRGSAGVKVAVVDCGIFSSQTGRLAGDGIAGHPDLRGKVAANIDYTGSSTGFDDYCDHGTHVAGIVAAIGNNGVGVSGLAPDVTLLNAKVLGDNGTGSTTNIANGIVWAVANGAKVINMSLGRDGPCSQTEQAAISNAWNSGVVVVAAAGNSGLNASGAPANCANVISVAATTATDQRASFSNYGTNVDVAAPGASILSTVRTGGYSYFNGTSMATPYVSALAGLILSANSNATATWVVNKIQTSSVPISGTGTSSGSSWAWGRIDAAAALAGSNGVVPTVTSTSSPVTSPTATNTPPPTQTPSPTATNTPTATPTHTATAAPVPTFGACPSPRPAVRLTMAPASGNSFNVTAYAGAGVIRQVEFRDLRNGNIIIGNQVSAQASFIYVPPSLAPSVTFAVAQQAPTVATTAGLVVTDDCGPWTTLVGSGVEGFKRGSLSGTIRNAGTSQPIAGAQVAVRGTGSSATTNANGVYVISSLGTGNVVVDVTAAGYTAASYNATVTNNQTTTLDGSLTPIVPVNTTPIVVSLAWGAAPADLDIHVSGPMTDGERFHTYWNDPDAAPHAVLGDDAHFGYGPESVTLRPDPTTQAWVAGEYRVWSHNYDGVGTYAGSGATVTVTRGGQTLGTFSVSGADGDPLQLLWYAATLTIDANGGVTLAPAQQFQSGGSSSTLRFQDGKNSVLSWPAKGKR